MSDITVSEADSNRLLYSGTTVEGVFHCRKSSENSRELDVEIHYKSYHPGEAANEAPTVVQLFKVQ